MNEFDFNLPAVKNEQVMTVKEIAEVLNVSETAVKDTVAKLRQVHGGVFSDIQKNRQGGYLFTERQVTMIKQEIQKHHNLASRQIDNVTTELEENAVIANAISILQRRANEYKQRAEIAEQQLALQQPKVDTYDRIANATGLKSIPECAKILHIGSKTLFAVLRDKGIIYKDNGVNLPNQVYIERGYFEVKEEPFKKDGKDFVYTRIFATAKGLLWLEKQIEQVA